MTPAVATFAVLLPSGNSPRADVGISRPFCDTLRQSSDPQQPNKFERRFTLSSVRLTVVNRQAAGSGKHSGSGRQHVSNTTGI